MIRFVIFCFCVVTLLWSVAAEVVNFGGCDYTDNLCDVNEVRIDPCKEASRNQACRIKRGKLASIDVYFTPKIAAQTLHSQPYWYNGINHIPLEGMDTDGCKTTTCPLQSGVKQQYRYELQLKPDYPLATYTVRWNLTSGTDGCCFSVRLKLTR
ncbi:hypothetical protein Trydic_g407 [Trypoxylus dichotomus]